MNALRFYGNEDLIISIFTLHKKQPCHKGSTLKIHVHYHLKDKEKCLGHTCEVLRSIHYKQYLD